MIKEQKKWMCYTYFHRTPSFHWKTSHLFSPVKMKIYGMVCVAFPTMTAEIKECDFLNSWSKSTKTKINKTENDALSVRRGIDLLPDILLLFSETARAKDLRGHFPDDSATRPWILSSAVYAGEKMLAGHVWLIDEEERRSLLFVNASGHQDVQNDSSLIGRAHYFLLWRDGMHLRNNGIDYMDLNGYNPDLNDPKLTGVYAWKEATHGQREQLFHYYPFWFYWLRRLLKKQSS